MNLPLLYVTHTSQEIAGRDTGHSDQLEAALETAAGRDANVAAVVVPR